MNDCLICGAEYAGFGHNAYPLIKGRCCDDCNEQYVIPARFAQLAADPEYCDFFKVAGEGAGGGEGERRCAAG